MKLECSNASFTYGEKNTVDNISLTLHENSFLCAAGPNGAGKTTLLKLLSGFIKPSSGSIKLDGEDIYGMPSRKRARLVTPVPQSMPPPLDFTVEEYLMTLADPFALSAHEKTNRIKKSLTEFDLDGFMDRRCSTLSGGEFKRAALAGACAFHGKFILLDEPTAPLDPNHAIQSMRNFSALSCGVFMITHSIELVSRFAKQTLLIKDGKTVSEKIDAGSLEKTFLCSFDKCTSKDGKTVIFAAI